MRTIANVLANWAAFISGTAITFVLSPFIVHHLGDARYGLWGVIGSIVGYLGLLDLGIRVAVTRFVAHHDAKGDQVALNRLVTTALGLFAGTGVIAAVLGGLIAVALPRLVDVPAEYVTEATVAVWIGGVTVGAALVGGVHGGVLAGLQRLTLLNAIDLGTEVLRAAAVFAALSAGGGLVDLALIQLGIVLLRGVLYRAGSRRLQPGIRASRTLFDAATLREILRFSTYTMILHVSAVVIFSSDAVVIGALMPVAQVTLFVIAGSLAQAVLRVLGGVSQALYPLVSARQATHGTSAAAELFKTSTRLATLVMLPIVLTLLIRGRTFIGLWMGSAYASGSGQVLEILSLGLCVFASYQVLTSTMMALNLHRGMVPAFVGEAAGNLALSIALGVVLGVNGVAWGTTVPRLVLSLGFGPWYARRTLGLPLREYALHAWVRPFASLIPFSATSLVIERAWPAQDLVTFFGQVILALPIAALGVWWMGLNSKERDLVRTGVKRVLGQEARTPGDVSVV